MSEQPDAEIIACSACGTTAPKPPHDGRSWLPLWTMGWRWMNKGAGLRKTEADPFKYSCPGCPSVLPSSRRPDPVPLKRQAPEG